MKPTLILMLIALTLGCNSTKEDPLLAEAAKIHEQAAKIEQQIRPQVAALVQQKNSINVQGRALAPEEVAFVQTVESIEAGHQFWKENHLEVPGYEHHDHDHADHDHDHDHAPKLELLPADMLAVQKEFRDTLLSVQQRIEMALQQAKQMEK